MCMWKLVYYSGVAKMYSELSYLKVTSLILYCLSLSPFFSLSLLGEGY